MSNVDEPSEVLVQRFESITSAQQHQPSITRSHSSSGVHRSNTDTSSKPERDPHLDVNLPYRTLTAQANLDEYTTENAGGEIDGPLESDGKTHYKLVTFTPNDPENPKNWSKAYKWYCTMVVAVTCFVVAFCSSVITAGIVGVQEEFDRSEEVALVSISIFVVGFGIGVYIRSDFLEFSC
jgi:hypothetical protein